MRLLNQLRAFVGISVALSVPFAEANILKGTTIDPHERAIVGARVVVICRDSRLAATTDQEGHFAFTGSEFQNCTIRVSQPGFATYEHRIEHEQVLTVQLHLPEIKQIISVHAQDLSTTAFGSVSVSSREMQGISDDTGELIEYVKQMAGVHSGSNRVYVNGLPTNYLPPADMIDTITVNSDPFSAEYSDGSDTHIDIITRSAERKFHMHLGGVSLGIPTRSALNSHLESSSRTGRLTLSGPIPQLPFTFSADGNVADRKGEDPVRAIVPCYSVECPHISSAARKTDLNETLVFSVYYAKPDRLRANASLYVSSERASNVNLSGLMLPEAGSNEDSRARELRVTIEKTGADYIYRGGLVSSWSNAALQANSNKLGIVVLGAFMAGGAEISADRVRNANWTMKNVLMSHWRNHYWAAGITASRFSQWRSELPNRFGLLQFDNLGEYGLAATAAAHTGTLFCTRGYAQIRYSSINTAPFAEAELLHTAHWFIRAGIRSDYQTFGDFLISPRLSASLSLKGFLIRSGGGLFVHRWDEDIFMRVIEHDGTHLESLMERNVSFSDQNDAVLHQDRLFSRTARHLEPTREWMTKLSVEHALGNFIPGAEYTWIHGEYLLGSRRLAAPVGWIDMLESSRFSEKHQVHLGMQYRWRGQSFTAHYEWLHSFDNTDGPFSFPARQGDVAGEWAPSSGVSPHNVNVISNLRFGKLTSVSLVEVIRSSVPLNVITGVDAEGDGLYTDRGRRRRNSGQGPSFKSLELFAHRRVAIWKRSTSRGKIYVDLGVEAENLIGTKNYLRVENVLGSPSFGQPLAASPARSVRFSFSLVPSN